MTTITRYRCHTCNQTPEDMQQIMPGAYKPTERELQRDSTFALCGIGHEQYVCKCGMTHNWWPLRQSEEPFYPGVN